MKQATKERAKVDLVLETLAFEYLCNIFQLLELLLSRKCSHFGRCEYYIKRYMERLVKIKV